MIITVYHRIVRLYRPLAKKPWKKRKKSCAASVKMYKNSSQKDEKFYITKQEKSERKRKKALQSVAFYGKIAELDVR